MDKEMSLTRTARSRLAAMNRRVDHLLIEALELPAAERSAVVAALVDSLEGDDSLAVVSDAWRRELLQRRDAFRSGTVQAAIWSEARARLNAL